MTDPAADAPPPFELSASDARQVAQAHGTPAYVYDEATLRARAANLLAFPAPFGLTARYAMKANPCRAVLRLFADAGLHFDASSVFEAERALLAGVPADRVQITAQRLGDGFAEVGRKGVKLTACSLRQVEQIGAALPGSQIALRINPGEGSGANQRTNVAGPAASFGIWHEQIDAVHDRADALGLTVTTLHQHVGSGGDPERWAEIAAATLARVEEFPDVHTINLGGGFKVARVAGETGTDLAAIGRHVARLLSEFADRTGRRLRLELEPGTYLAANGGALVGRVDDVVTTGADGYTFVKVDVGMAEIVRPAMYGAQHSLRFIAADPDGSLGDAAPLLVVGPCCESGDILTPAPGDAEGLAPRELPLPAPGDLVIVGGAGAYCSSMSAAGYNSIPAAPEILRRESGELALVRRRQTLPELLDREL